MRAFQNHGNLHENDCTRGTMVSPCAVVLVEVAMILEGAHAVARRILVLAAFILAVAASAAAQKPTFEIEGVVIDAQQAVLPGATVTLQNVATGLSRETATDAERPLRLHRAPARGSTSCRPTLAGFATEAPREPDVQRRPARRAQLHAEAVERAGDRHRRRRVAGGPDDERRR